MTAPEVRPLVSLSGTVSVEVPNHHVRFWDRLSRFGAHADDEIVRLWELVRRDESRVETDAALLWRRLEDIGAAADAEVADLWARITA